MVEHGGLCATLLLFLHFRSTEPISIEFWFGALKYREMPWCLHEWVKGLMGGRSRQFLSLERSSVISSLTLAEGLRHLYLAALIVPRVLTLGDGVLNSS